MTFVDLHTGELYDGSNPYIHWFPGELSTNLIYTMTLAVVSEKTNLSINIDSDVFKILDLSKGNVYKDIITDSINNVGVVINKNSIIKEKKYLHVIYLSACVEHEGEYHTDLFIDGEQIEIAGDFYGEEESLYINLSNMGVELPDAIQRAIYSSDIYECKKDNILLNRKLKELLSNYWDVIANRGSYKSMLNSLKWFEWGDKVRLREIWKHEDFGRIVYDDRDLCSIMEEKYNDFYNRFSKTTHLSLTHLMHYIVKDEYDEEWNPALEPIVENITRNELMLKMVLLGNFYETYFLPIHLNLMHATLENVVFSNTVKLLNGTAAGRHDMIYLGGEGNNRWTCSVKDGNSYVLGNVKCYVNKDTFFRNDQYVLDYKDVYIMGVDTEVKDAGESMKDNQVYFTQRYGGVGVVVPFECNFGDNEIIESVCNVDGKFIRDYRIFTGSINFNLLFRTEGSHNIYLQFRASDSTVFAKHIKINIVDVSGIDVKVYRIKRLDPVTVESKYEMGDFINNIANFNFSRNITGEVINQIIPTVSISRPTGVCLNNVLVLNTMKFWEDYELDRYYFKYIRGSIKKVTGDDGNVTEEDNRKIICISKEFWFNPEVVIPDFNKIYGDYIYRNDYGFFSRYHTLKELGGDAMENYMVYNDALMVVPELPYGLVIDKYDWEFINVTTGKTFKLDYFQSPIIADKKPLDPGYYDIIFRYNVGGSTHEMKIESAFIQR